MSALLFQMRSAALQICDLRGMRRGNPVFYDANDDFGD
jgi:hypothetical protein